MFTPLVLIRPSSAVPALLLVLSSLAPSLASASFFQCETHCVSIERLNHGISIQNYELDPILGDTRYYTKKDLLGALESECSIQSQGQGFIFEALELKTLDSTEFPLLEINRSYARNYRLGSFSNLSARTPSILDLRSFSYSPMTTWDSGYRHWNHHAYSRIVWNEQLEESELSLKFWKPSARFGSSCRTLKRAPHADENTMPYLGTARILSQ